MSDVPPMNPEAYGYTIDAPSFDPAYATARYPSINSVAFQEVCDRYEIPAWCRKDMKKISNYDVKYI